MILPAMILQVDRDHIVAVAVKTVKMSPDQHQPWAEDLQPLAEAHTMKIGEGADFVTKNIGEGVDVVTKMIPEHQHQ